MAAMPQNLTLVCALTAVETTSGVELLARHEAGKRWGPSWSVFGVYAVTLSHCANWITGLKQIVPTAAKSYGTERKLKTMPFEISNPAITSRLEARSDVPVCNLSKQGCIPQPMLDAANGMGGLAKLVDSYDDDKNGRLSFRKWPWSNRLEGDQLMLDYGLKEI